MRQEIFAAARGDGATLDDRKIRVSGRKELEYALIGTGFPFRAKQHFPAYQAMFNEFFQSAADVRRAGSAALDLAYVAAGRLDGFWEIGLAPWDMAAGALLIREAGGLIGDFSGNDRYLETGNIVGGTDGTVSITASAIPGDALDLSVTDADLDTDPGVAETVSVTVTSSNGETETVTLTETGANTGIFENTLATIFGAAAGTDNDATLNAAAGDTVTVSFDDTLTSTGGTATVTDNGTIVGGVNGVVTITANAIPGDALDLSVTDADLDTDPGVAETVDVTVTSSNGETETVTLTETGANTGIFENTLATTFGATAGTDNDGTLNAAAGDTVTLSYDDALTSTGGTATVTDSDAVGGGTSGTVDITDASIPGDTLTITVTDADLDTNPAAADSVDVTVTNEDTLESETITLTETGSNTGIFTGTVDTQFGTASEGNLTNGLFNTQAGDTVTASYDDDLTITGGTATVTDFNVATDAGALSFDGGDGGSPTTTYLATTLTGLSAGTYSLSEDDVDGYSEGTWSCTNGDGGAFDSGSVTLGNGDSVTCEITNDDDAAALKLVKIVDNDLGAVDHSLTV